MPSWPGASAAEPSAWPARYSWDRLDNGGVPSADRIRPELQETKRGDVLPSRAGHDDGFLVLELERPEHLIMQRKQLLNLKARAESPAS